MTTFTGKAITDHAALADRIMQLSLQKYNEEQELKRDIKEIYNSIHPANIIQNVLHNVEVKNDLKTAGLSVGVNYLIGKVFGRSSSIKGYFSSILFEKLANYVLNKYSPAIFESLGKTKSFSNHTPIDSDFPDRVERLMTYEQETH